MFVLMEDLEKKSRKICEDYHLPISVFLADCFINKKTQEEIEKTKNIEQFVCNTYCDDLIHNHRDVYEKYYTTHNYLTFLKQYANIKNENYVSLANKITEYDLRKYDVA